MPTMSDFFCGAGGSSTGAIQVPGVSVKVAANHWKLAVDTHERNHPTTRHFTANLSDEDPRDYPKTDIGWFSPECTNHSLAKGVKRTPRYQLIDLLDELEETEGRKKLGKDGRDPAAERSRATMWNVIDFAEIHQYRYIIVENVVDAREWVLWPAWALALSRLGYEFQPISLNSMFAGAFGPAAAQSRDRLYVVAWKKGERAPDFNAWLRPYADCPTHGLVAAIQGWKDPSKQVGKYRQQYVYRCPRVECRNTEVTPPVRPAADIIDWTLPAQRIGDRKKPLAEKTMKRIREGLNTYGRPLPEGVDVSPMMVPVEGREGKTAAPASRPLRTCTTRNETGLAVPPFIAELRGGGSKHRSVSDPLSTVCASGNHHGLTIPDLVAPYYGNTSPRPAGEPLPTVTTVDRHALLRGGVVSSVDDLRFRMLQPSEYAAAMEFPDTYEWMGTKRDRVKMAGNAVTTNAARDLVAMVVAAMTGETVPTWGMGLAA